MRPVAFYLPYKEKNLPEIQEAKLEILRESPSSILERCSDSAKYHTSQPMKLEE
jgi:hypothetical protein